MFRLLLITGLLVVSFQSLLLVVYPSPVLFAFLLFSFVCYSYSLLRLASNGLPK